MAFEQCTFLIAFARVLQCTQYGKWLYLRNRGGTKAVGSSGGTGALLLCNLYTEYEHSCIIYSDGVVRLDARPVTLA